MKQSPEMQKLEEVLRSHAFSAEGFMGTDSRALREIIDADLAELNAIEHTSRELADKMRQITTTAKEALGNWAKVGDNLEARTSEAKGRIPCPWPHAGNFAKRVTVLRNTSTDEEVRWSDLNIHLIEEHNFFEGHGSPFRIEPRLLCDMLMK